MDEKRMGSILYAGFWLSSGIIIGGYGVGILKEQRAIEKKEASIPQPTLTTAPYVPANNNDSSVSLTVEKYTSFEHLSFTQYAYAPSAILKITEPVNDGTLEVLMTDDGLDNTVDSISYTLSRGKGDSFKEIDAKWNEYRKMLDIDAILAGEKQKKDAEKATADSAASFSGKESHP